MSADDDGEIPENEVEVYEWSAFYDDEGRIYYYNSTSGESSWDPPEKFNPPPNNSSEEPKPGDNTSYAEGDNDNTNNGETASTNQNAWVAYQDDEGREYYFNTVTQETTWDKPEGFEPSRTVDDKDGYDDEPQPGDESPMRASSPILGEEPPPTPEPEEPMDADDNDDDRGDSAIVKEEEPEEPVIDPAIQRLEEARAALKQTDAIMEPGVLAHVTTVVTSEGGKPLTAIEALSESYFGETAACGLMGRWLAELKSQAAASETNEQERAFADAADEIRDMVQDVINRISKERFTQKGGDSILGLSKAEVAFLTEMMISSRWRKLLIDLSASNKDSALLMYCLEQISKRGHHREIARRINQSDHFSVFNAMLASELSVIGMIAVSSCKGSDTSISLAELVGDVQRTCTSTAYTYIYAIEVLRQLIVTAKEKSLKDPAFQSPLFARAIRKWERLNEDLQSTIVDPDTAAGSTPLFRKRRLDVAVTISELHQRQRRRIVPTDDSSDDDDAGIPKKAVGNGDDRHARVETAVLEFLRRYSLGTRVDDRILDKMLPDSLTGDPTNLVGKLMIKRPLTVKALLGYLYKPGTQRVADVVTKNKCARLIALAVHAAEDEALAEAKLINESLSVDHDEVALSRMLLEGSRLCETLENMVSFIVTSTTDHENPGAADSPGQQLSSLAMKCAAVAQGVAIWAREVTKGSEFVHSASYPTLSPSILSLVRVLLLKHPCIGHDVLEVALCFLKHSNSEISYQTLNEIKEQSLRLLLFLCIRGEAPAVLAQVTNLLTQSGTICLDASLVRYFVSGLLEVMKAPFSFPLVRLLSALLKAPGTVDAIKTTYFAQESKQRLDRVIRYMGDLEHNGTLGKLSPEDSKLFKSVVATYNT